MSKEVVKVLGITTYDFKNDQGQEVKGGAMHYMSDYNFNEPSKRGYFPIKETITVEMFEELKMNKFPVNCELEIVQVPNNKGKSVAKITSVKVKIG